VLEAYTLSGYVGWSRSLEELLFQSFDLGRDIFEIESAYAEAREVNLPRFLSRLRILSELPTVESNIPPALPCLHRYYSHDQAARTVDVESS